VPGCLGGLAVDRTITSPGPTPAHPRPRGRDGGILGDQTGQENSGPSQCLGARIIHYLRQFYAHPQPMPMCPKSTKGPEMLLHSTMKSGRVEADASRANGNAGFQRGVSLPGLRIRTSSGSRRRVTALATFFAEPTIDEQTKRSVVDRFAGWRPAFLLFPNVRILQPFLRRRTGMASDGFRANAFPNSPAGRWCLKELRPDIPSYRADIGVVKGELPGQEIPIRKLVAGFPRCCRGHRDGVAWICRSAERPDQKDPEKTAEGGGPAFRAMLSCRRRATRIAGGTTKFSAPNIIASACSACGDNQGRQGVRSTDPDPKGGGGWWEQLKEIESSSFLEERLLSPPFSRKDGHKHNGLAASFGNRRREERGSSGGGFRGC